MMRAVSSNTPTPGPWVTISTFQGNWGALANYQAPAYRVWSDGSIEFRGACTAATNTATMFTLPVGVRPATDFALGTGSMQEPLSPGVNEAAAIFFDTNGDVQQIGNISAANVQVFLDGVHVQIN